MCEILVDDFSFLNAATEHPDAYIETGGFEAGLQFGNTQAVHRVVESLLRFDQIVHTDDWTSKELTIPVRVYGPHRAAIGDMTARLRLALQRPKRVYLVPCDGYGATAWWRIAWAQMDAVYDDLVLDLANPYADFMVRLGVEAFPHSTELFSAVADPDISDDVLWDVDVDEDDGWAASGGPITYSAGNYVGVNSDALSGTVDKLEKDSLVWDATDYTTISVEWSATDPGGGGVDYAATEPYMYIPDGIPTFGSKVARVDLTGGWFRDTFLLPDGLSAANAGIGVGLTGSTLDTDLRIRKITLAASSEAGKFQDLWFDMPGSAPTSTTITLTGDVDPGLLLYTCPNLPETTEMPIVYGTGSGLYPEGLYHLVCRFSTVGAVTGLHWEVTGSTFLGSDVIQSGDVEIEDMAGSSPAGGSQWVVLATDIVLPAQALPAGQLATANVEITKIGGTSVTVDDPMLLWMGNPLTGEMTAAYSILEPRAGHNVVQAAAPTPERPVWSLFTGTSLDGLYQEHRAIIEIGRHDVRPGKSRVFVALAGGGTPEVHIAAEAYPAWDYIVPPPSRWPSS